MVKVHWLPLLIVSLTSLVFYGSALSTLSGCEAETATDTGCCEHHQQQIDKLRRCAISVNNALQLQANELIKIQGRIEVLERGEHSVLVKPEKKCEPSKSR